MRNVFVQLETDGTHLARHSNKTSRIIEKIIPCLHGDLFEKFLQLVEAEIEMLASDRFSSHVIETICKNVTSHLNSSETFADVFVSFCKVLRKSCSKLIRDTYGSHVLSTVLQVLSGVQVPDVVTKSQASRKSKKKKGPKVPLLKMQGWLFLLIGVYTLFSNRRLPPQILIFLKQFSPGHSYSTPLLINFHRRFQSIAVSRHYLTNSNSWEFFHPLPSYYFNRPTKFYRFFPTLHTILTPRPLESRECTLSCYRPRAGTPVMQPHLVFKKCFKKYSQVMRPF